jgi:hypothetical protein
VCFVDGAVAQLSFTPKATARRSHNQIVLVLRRPDFANRQSCQPMRAKSYVGQAVLVLESLLSCVRQLPEIRSAQRAPANPCARQFEDDKSLTKFIDLAAW